MLGFLLFLLGTITTLVAHNTTDSNTLGPMQELSSSNTWLKHAQYMFEFHGKQISLIYEPPMSVASMSFLPTPFNVPDLVVAQLQNIQQSTFFEGFSTTSPEVISFRKMRYLRSLPGLCFCCYAKNGNFGTFWPPYKMAQRQWGGAAKNYTACNDYFFLYGRRNTTYSSGYTLANSTYYDIYHTFPMFSPNYKALTGSVCSRWVIKDPELWFFWGDGWATNYHPGGYQCAAIGYLTLPVQVQEPQKQHRLLRAADGPGPMGPLCKDDIIINRQSSGGEPWGRALAGSLTGVLTLGAYPGIIAQENRHSIIGLTCRLEKTVNATARIVRHLQQEITELSQIQLQHRFALDFLLARQGGFCKIVGKAGCMVKYKDLNKTIEDELAHLQNLVQNNVRSSSEGGLDWASTLTSWIPKWGWLKDIFRYGIPLLAFCVSLCCCIQCTPSLMATLRSCVSRVESNRSALAVSVSTRYFPVSNTDPDEASPDSNPNNSDLHVVYRPIACVLPHTDTVLNQNQIKNE